MKYLIIALLIFTASCRPVIVKEYVFKTDTVRTIVDRSFTVYDTLNVERTYIDTVIVPYVATKTIPIYRRNGNIDSLAVRIDALTREFTANFTTPPDTSKVITNERNTNSTKYIERPIYELPVMIILGIVLGILYGFLIMKYLDKKQ